MTTMFVPQLFLLGLLVSSLLRGGNCSCVVQNGACVQFLLVSALSAAPLLASICLADNTC